MASVVTGCPKVICEPSGSKDRRSSWSSDPDLVLEGNSSIKSTATNKTPPDAFHGLPELQADNIRLVRLEPRSASGDIRCTLIVANLSNATYEALSYEWGPTLPLLEISINGKKTAVRKNLWWALSYLQLSHATRVLWIDALSINQVNTTERNHQVAMMGLIYASSTRCVAYIGKERQRNRNDVPDTRVDNCWPAIKFLQERQQKALDQDWTKDFIHQDQLVLSLEDLCTRDYWSRLWIIQEILLPRAVLLQCGSQEVRWSTLSTLCGDILSLIGSFTWSEPIGSKSHKIPMMLTNISRTMPFMLHEQSVIRGSPAYNKTPASTLAQMVERFRGSECVDRRDKVFGLLSLTRTCCRLAVPADYALTPLELCDCLINHEITQHLDLSSKVPSNFNNIAGIMSVDSDEDGSHALDTMDENAGKVLWISSIGNMKTAMIATQTTGSLYSVLTEDYDLARAFHCIDTFMPSTEARATIFAYFRTLFSTLDQHANGFDSEIRGANLELINKNFNFHFNPTHVFMTDLGDFGIAESDLQLGARLRKDSGDWYNLKVHYETPESLADKVALRLGHESQFNKFLSWLVSPERVESSDEVQPIFEG